MNEIKDSMERLRVKMVWIQVIGASFIGSVIVFHGIGQLCGSFPSLSISDYTATTRDNYGPLYWLYMVLILF